MSNRYCLIIPCYRHAKPLYSVLERLSAYKIDVIVVDDGNDNLERALIEDTVNRHCDFTSLLHHDVNMGKAKAFRTGLVFARDKGYTHAIQIDADGQHDINDLDKAIKLSDTNEDCIISGNPIYSDDAPKSRVYGRKITTFFVAVETMSLSLKDAMIGFRVYPVNKALNLIEKYNLKDSMCFEIEILVRAYWMGIKTKFFDTKITYPEDGISNFKGSDNLKISLMHTKLCTLAFFYLPLRLFTHGK